MKLPAIDDKIVLRPGGEKHFIPAPEFEEFWLAFYEFMRKNFSFEEPVRDIKNKINPYFGNFGMRFQAVGAKANYFHLGLDITEKPKIAVHSIYDGLLEYSGFGHVNGKYVFLSHPDIETEDGFVMHTLYLHMRSLDVGFGSYQKMLRKISFNKYPNVPIKKNKKLGGVGSTGNIEGIHTHLHLQVEFRNDAGKIVVVDPALLLGLQKTENITSRIKDEAEFLALYEPNKKDIKALGIEKYWRIKK